MNKHITINRRLYDDENKNIGSNRKKTAKKKLTQEELAEKLGVSSQAISNWERGGYPDIALLPHIADAFAITIDELLGHDEITRKADISSFRERIKTGYSKPENLAMAKEYYKKYPNDFEIMEHLAFAIHNNIETKQKNYPLLREISEKIMKNCTWEYTRQNILEIMSIDCTDEEWEGDETHSAWKDRCPQFYSAQVNEILEQRHFVRGNSQKYHTIAAADYLMNLLHFFGREYMLYYDKNQSLLFDAPESTVALMKCRMNIIESLGNGQIPEAFSGMYADMSLKLAGALIGSENLDEGFAELEKTFFCYERWLDIPNGKQLKTENPAFGGATINKVKPGEYQIHITMPSGTVVWCPYLWLFWQEGKDIERAMNGAGMIGKDGKPETGWVWFKNVKDDKRFLSFLERAKSLPHGTQKEDV